MLSISLIIDGGQERERQTERGEREKERGSTDATQTKDREGGSEASADATINQGEHERRERADRKSPRVEREGRCHHKNYN